jgi:predicted signal transduction protein with EAL and GGDEF domain
MENTLSLYLKKYGIAICLVINQAICIYLLSYESDFKSPRIYLHLVTLGMIAFIAIKYPEYQRMLAIAFLLLIFYLLVAR